MYQLRSTRIGTEQNLKNVKKALSNAVLNVVIRNPISEYTYFLNQPWEGGRNNQLKL
jgi:hypothetical protein